MSFEHTNTHIHQCCFLFVFLLLFLLLFFVVFVVVLVVFVYTFVVCLSDTKRSRYCLFFLTLPVDPCLFMGFLIAWCIIYSRALHGEL